MGLLDDINKNFYFTKKFTYKDVIKILEDYIAEEEQKDTEDTSFYNQEVN